MPANRKGPYEGYTCNGGFVFSGLCHRRRKLNKLRLQKKKNNDNNNNKTF